MLDIKQIRENQQGIQKGLAAKGVDMDLAQVMNLDECRRKLLIELDDCRSQQNKANDEIAKLKKSKKDFQEIIEAMKDISAKVSELEPQVKDLKTKIDAILLNIPNVPHTSVPVGGVDKNEIIRQVGEIKKFDFMPKDHVELTEALDIIDFKRGAKITGSHFVLFKGMGARLERALINFMLDVQTKAHGYTEVSPPFLVNRQSMTGTGQLPKMEEDMYRLKEDDLFLIPTAEVPVTNIHADEILKEEELPIKYTAYSACFRREAGSYGKDTKGLIRIHQFDKVELVQFVRPEESYAALDELVSHAEKIFQMLGLCYRIVVLASGDLSFASAKTFDLEVYAPGVDKWLETSSCSNFEDFQARRSNIRFKGKTVKKPNFIHTLNGSGLALARLVIAIIENYQTKEGGIIIPEALRPYMDGVEKIE